MNNDGKHFGQQPDKPQWLRRIRDAVLFVGRGFDALLGRIIEPPERKSVVVAGPGVWRDTPKVVPFSHGFRWHWDAPRLFDLEMTVEIPGFGILVYGALCCYGVLCLTGPRPLRGLFPVVMGLIPPFWGFCSARGMQAAQQGNTAWKATLRADLMSGAYLFPLLFLSLCLGLLWHCLPFWDVLLRRLYPPSTPSLRLIWCWSGGIILFMTGQFLAAALAVTQNTGLAGLGRICRAGVRNGSAFLACGLLILPFSVVIGALCLLLFAQGGRLKVGLFALGSVSALFYLMELAYAAVRDIYYYEEQEESPPAGDA